MKFSKNISLDQRALPFGNIGRKGALAYALPWERQVVGVTGVLFVGLCLLYAYFVIMSIVHVAALQTLMAEVTTAKNNVSQLETAYFAKSDTITETYAESLGYVAVANPTFVAENTALTLQ